jgi:DNA-binding transcriptional LysR family regulator
MRPDLELRHLWYFVAVAEELSFSRAAARVGIAQPPLSQQIQKLEALLGCALFDRSGRRVRLTEAGTVLVAEARRLLADAKQTTDLMRRVGRGETGTITIGFWPSTLFSPLPAAVRQFRERHPGVVVRLREIFPPDHAIALRAGTIDVAILREPDPEVGISEMPVLVEPFVAVVPADHRLAARRTIEVKILRDEPFVLFPREAAPGVHAKLYQLCRGAGFEPRVLQEAEAWHTIISLVEAGIGVSLIPASFEGRRAGALAYLALKGSTVRTTTVACARAAGRSHVADAFLEVLRTTVGGSPAITIAGAAPRSHRGSAGAIGDRPSGARGRWRPRTPPRGRRRGPASPSGRARRDRAARPRAPR